MDKTALSNRLIYLADLLESLSDSEDYNMVKEVKREYKTISNQLYPPTKEHELPAKQVKESREKALEQIKFYLQAPDIEEQFENKKEDDKLVVWVGNVNGFPKEFTIECVDSFYGSMSGYKCITASRCLFSEKQLKGYRTYERALLETGLKLCSGRKQKKEFFDKYIIPYNGRLQKEREYGTSTENKS